MRKILPKAAFIFLTCTLVLHTGCDSYDSGSGSRLKDIASGTASGTVRQMSVMNKNEEKGIKVSEPEIADNLKALEIENLNDENNSLVTIELPDDWYAKKFIFDLASNFKFSAEKNKQIQKTYTYELYNPVDADKYKGQGYNGQAGEFYLQAYYRDQPESSIFPNHSMLKASVYSGETILGQGVIFILDCDLPRDMRTDKYKTYEMVYAWIPVENEELAYNLKLSVPVGEDAEYYTSLAEKMLGVKE